MTKKKTPPPEPPKVAVMYDNARTEPNTIRMYFHCRRCLEEFKAGVDHLGDPLGPMAPAEYCRLNVGLTEEGGWQVWCVRHEINVVKWHIEEGQ